MDEQQIKIEPDSDELIFQEEPSVKIELASHGALEAKEEVTRPKNIPKQRKKLPSHWDVVEQSRYLTFLKQRKEVFHGSFKEKKGRKIFHRLSAFIKTRTSVQCKSHHQKMIKRYETVENIISALMEEPNGTV